MRNAGRQPLEITEVELGVAPIDLADFEVSNSTCDQMIEAEMIKGNLLHLTIILAGFCGGASALYPALASPLDDSAGSGVPSFKTDIQPLIEAKCVRCHTQKVHKADLDLSTLKGLNKGGESGPIIVAGKPEQSLLYQKIHAGEMPPAAKDRLKPSEIDMVRRWIVSGASASGEVPEQSETAVSQHDVIPIMLRHCTVCHGLRQKMGNLDLRTKSSMLRGGKSGPAIVLGNPEASLLMKRIRAGEMPPPEQLVEASVKPVDSAETETILRWLKSGAPEVKVEPDVATTQPDSVVTDRDRDFWAFRSPKPVMIPQVSKSDRLRNPIDAFILQKLESKKLSLAPDATRSELIRRASFDLTGLPPSPEEVQAFLTDPSSDAYDRLIERLLASPRYGERWGRYWLDLAGYADSEGKREQDLPRPHAWRYRDYVIKSFNTDKPYNQFLQEQLAGDELVDYEHASEITDDIYEKLVATGFLRMAPDASWANITGYATDRVEVIADEIDVLGSVVMGLTLKCARCHSHKFDPIPQRDYYRLIDVFKGAYDEYDWLKPDVRPGLGPISQDTIGGRLLNTVTTRERRAWEQNEQSIQASVGSTRVEVDREYAQRASIQEARLLAQLPPVLHGDLKRMLVTPSDQRDPILRYLAEKFEKQLRIDREALKRADPEFKKLVEQSDQKIAKLESRREAEPKIQALWDRGVPSPTYLYRRGDLQSPGRLIGPGVPSVLTDGKTAFVVEKPSPGTQKTGRRLAFARWVSSPGHPLTARVAVNRIWKHHFGVGIVSTLDNFGKAGTPPTHPELLDWLSIEFVRQGWSFKAMHRLMMLSSTYRQSSVVSQTQESADPSNQWLSRMPMKRLDAEALYDVSLLVSGSLNEAPTGPSDPVSVRPDGLVLPVASPSGWRRMVYVRQSRKQVPTHLENFDYPQMNPNCVDRRNSIVVLQALELMNSGMVHELGAKFAQRILREVGTDPSKQIDRIYLIAMSRYASPEEKSAGLDSLKRLEDLWLKTSSGLDKVNVERSRTNALTTFCHAILNSAAFVYVD